MTYSLIHYLTTASFALTSLSWVAATLGLLWLGHSLHRTMREPISALLYGVALAAIALVLITITSEIILIASRFSETLALKIHAHHELFLNVMNWINLLANLCWLVAGVAFLFCCLKIKKSSAAPPSPLNTPNPSDETYGEPI